MEGVMSNPGGQHDEARTAPSDPGDELAPVRRAGRSSGVGSPQALLDLWGVVRALQFDFQAFRRQQLARVDHNTIAALFARSLGGYEATDCAPSHSEREVSELRHTVGRLVAVQASDHAGLEELRALTTGLKAEQQGAFEVVSRERATRAAVVAALSEDMSRIGSQVDALERSGRSDQGAWKLGAVQERVETLEELFEQTQVRPRLAVPSISVPLAQVQEPGDLSDLQRNAQQVRDGLASLDGRVGSMEPSLKDLTAQLNQLRSTLEARESEAEQGLELLRRRVDAVLPELTARAKHMDSAVADLREEIKEVDRKEARSQELLAALGRTLDAKMGELGAQLSALSNNVDSTRKRQIAIEQRVEALKVEGASQTEQAVSRVERQCAESVRSVSESLNSHVARLFARVEALEKLNGVVGDDEGRTAADKNVTVRLHELDTAQSGLGEQFRELETHVLELESTLESRLTTRGDGKVDTSVMAGVVKRMDSVESTLGLSLDVDSSSSSSILQRVSLAEKDVSSLREQVRVFFDGQAESIREQDAAARSRKLDVLEAAVDSDIRPAVADLVARADAHDKSDLAAQESLRDLQQRMANAALTVDTLPARVLEWNEFFEKASRAEETRENTETVLGKKLCDIEAEVGLLRCSLGDHVDKEARRREEVDTDARALLELIEKAEK